MFWFVSLGFSVIVRRFFQEEVPTMFIGPGYRRSSCTEVMSLTVIVLHWLLHHTSCAMGFGNLSFFSTAMAMLIMAMLR